MVQIGGNLTATSFGGISSAAKRAKIPIFAFQQAQVKEGAQVVLARDYFDAGKDAAAIAARIMRGESPAKIPFQPFSKTKLIINLATSRAVGLQIPPALQSRAAELIKE